MTRTGRRSSRRSSATDAMSARSSVHSARSSLERVSEMSEKEFSVYMSGVGGQGLVLLSNVIGSACATSGIRAITGEQHGLSQRSGSINVHLRMGEKVRSPLIPIGGADAILALEALEALRYVEYLKSGGVVLMNSRIQHPTIETGAHMKDKTAKYLSVEEGKTRR